MFEKVITWIKGAINKMYDTSSIEKDFNIDISSNYKVMRLIEECANIYNGRAPWISEEVKSLNVAKTICDKVAKAVTIEFQSKVEDEGIDEIYQSFLKNIRTNTEYTLAKGGIYFKPFYSDNTIKISCIQGDKFIPVKFDSTGELLGAIFIDQITKGDEVYTRLEYQEISNRTITIRNIAYKNNKNNSTKLGSKISLSLVPEWKGIKEITKINNVNKLLGGYFKIPIANPVDNTSPIGVPIFANAIEILKEIDEQFSRTLWEYEGAELAVDVDDTAFKKDKNNNPILPKGKKRLYRLLDFGDESNWNVYSPTIRDTSLFNGLNEWLRQCENQCGLSFGVLSKETSIAKTATEINSSKQDYYVTVSDIQKSLQNALDDLIYGIDVLMTLYKIPHKIAPGISYEWDDSIIVDTEREQTIMMQEANMGYIKKELYLMKRYGVTEEQARKMLPEEKEEIAEDEE